MTPEATRNLLIRRRELTGETFNDRTVHSWGDLLADVEYADAVTALNRAATEHERVNARHLHEHLPTRRTVEQAPIGDPDCDRCEDATGFIPYTDRHGTIRWMPCPGCRPAEAAKINMNADYPAPIQFACAQPAERAAREAHESHGLAAIRAIKAEMGWHQVNCAHCDRPRRQLQAGAPAVETGRYPDEDIHACECECHTVYKRWVLNMPESHQSAHVAPGSTQPTQDGQ